MPARRDDDNDGVLTATTAAPLDPTQCRDLDGDTCDDCSVVQPPDPPTTAWTATSTASVMPGDPDDDGDGYSDDGVRRCSDLRSSDPLDAGLHAGGHGR